MHIPFEFVIFGLTLLGVAFFNKQSLIVALVGLTSMLAYTALAGPALATPFVHVMHEWRVLVNLFGLITGFTLLASHFDHSGLPGRIGHCLPGGWKSGFVLLVMVCIISSFLDNIAAAMIGGATVRLLCKRVHIGYLAAIVAASNAGGSGSVIGDTTTTMLWVSGVHAVTLLPAYVGAGLTLLVFGVIAAKQQHALCPVEHDVDKAHAGFDLMRLGIVVMILTAAVVANLLVGMPAVGVWVAILIGATVRKTDWPALPSAMKGAVFLLALVTCAGLVPVARLPTPTWHSTLGLGFISAVFDNIPLTSLAIHQGGYDWAMLSYCVGFGGSMIWFGSSAGVAIANLFPEARSSALWLKNGWHVTLAYVMGFAFMLWLLGWHPQLAPGREATATPKPVPSASMRESRFHLDLPERSCNFSPVFSALSLQSDCGMGTSFPLRLHHGNKRA